MPNPPVTVRSRRRLARRALNASLTMGGMLNQTPGAVNGHFAHLWRAFVDGFAQMLQT
jgi:hypothetical protein